MGQQVITWQQYTWVIRLTKEIFTNLPLQNDIVCVQNEISSKTEDTFKADQQYTEIIKAVEFTLHLENAELLAILFLFISFSWLLQRLKSINICPLFALTSVNKSEI